MTDTPMSPTMEFEHLLEQEWQYWAAQFPEWATVVGAPGHNDRWTDLSPEAIHGRSAHIREVDAALMRINRTALDAATQLHLDLYRDLVSTAVEGLRFHLDACPIRGVVPRLPMLALNQLEGLPQDVPMLLSLQPAGRVSEVEDMLARLERVPALVAQTVAQLSRGLNEGIAPPATALRGVGAQLDAQIGDERGSSPILEPFRHLPQHLDERAAERCAREATRLFTSRVRPALEHLREFWTGAYLPACRETAGVSALPDGEALYAFLLRWHTSTALTPREVHDLGLEEVRRIGSEMRAVINRTGFTGTFEAFARFLRSDRSFYFTDAEALLLAYRDICKRADPQLARFFGRLPQTPYGVLPVPDASAPTQTTAYYQPGALSAGRAGYFYANTFNLGGRPRWEMEALALHEAVPGHHLQVALAQELAHLPQFRRHASYTAYIEGWALYAERLGEEMGFYENPYAKFGQLTYEMWRAVRLVVDTGLHAFGWTRDQAIGFFATHAPKTIEEIAVEVDRYMVWPGQAVGYKIGEIRIRALRARAETRLGAAFDLRAFHDLLLGEGALPLDVLDRRVQSWIEAQSPTGAS